MAKKITKKKPQVMGIVGVGLDNEDGHQRITRNEDVLLVGGSQETHERMQDVSIRFNESLKSRGKRLQEAHAEEVIELLTRALED